MIDKKDLFEIAKFKQLAPRLAELDYLQDIALLNLYREFGNKLVFKGGTCLYKVYKLMRFSEDLDFNGRRGFKPKKFFHKLPYFFQLLDMNSRVRMKPFESGTNVYLDINGPLYDGKKESIATIIFNISVRERTLLGIQRHPYKPVYQEIRPFDLFVMDEEEILAEKVRAIYGRNKARDVFDLWYLLKIKEVPFDTKFINKKLKYDKIGFEKETFLNKIQEKKLSWERDLSGLVIGELPSLEQAKKEILERIGKN